MKNSDDLNLIGRDLIENREWKAMNYRASQGPINDRVLVRISNDKRQRLVNALHELQVEIFALTSVPLLGFGELDDWLRE